MSPVHGECRGRWAKDGSYVVEEWDETAENMAGGLGAWILVSITPEPEPFPAEIFGKVLHFQKDYGKVEP